MDDNTTTIVCVLIGAVVVTFTGAMIAGAIMNDGPTPSERQIRERTAEHRLNVFEKKLAAYNKKRDKEIEKWEETNPMPEIAASASC